MGAPESASPLSTADSNSDSNTGAPLWSTASRSGEGAQVADAYERR
jgi:hypothetical protein